MKIQLKVNGRTTSVDAPPNTLLVHALREELKLASFITWGATRLSAAPAP